MSLVNFFHLFYRLSYQKIKHKSQLISNTIKKIIIKLKW